MIKFGIPSFQKVEDLFPEQSILTVHANEGGKTKRRLSLSRTAAEKLKVVPGISKLSFSFDGGNFIAVIPDGVAGVSENDKVLVSKEMSFMNKKVADFLCSKFGLDESKDNNLVIESFTEEYGLTIGSFSGALYEIPAETTEVATENVQSSTSLM